MAGVHEMVQQLLTERRVGMAEAGRFVGPKTHATTVTRWCLRGVRLPDGRVLKLEHFRCVGKIYTTTDAITRFLTAQTEFTSPVTCGPRTPAQRQRAAVDAVVELERLGGVGRAHQLCGAGRSG
jgi:hypothetical protein